MKQYRGFANDLNVVVQSWPNNMRTLHPRYDLRNHSPDGFNWGYGGSGPAQLALAICCDALNDDDRAQRIYQAFKFRRVCNLPVGQDWTLTERDVLNDVEALEAENTRIRAAMIEAEEAG